MAQDFTGKLSISIELDCIEADADFIAANLTRLLEDRTASFLAVADSTVHVERYSA